MPRKSLFDRLGPGFVSGAADDDPSGIATYTQTGAQFGLSQLWIAPWSVPFMVAVQETCGRIGLVTGLGLATIIRNRYSKGLLGTLVALLFAANVINIGANLGAMAAALQLLFGLPFAAWLMLITALSLGLEVFVSYPSYARFLKWLALSLLAYVAAAFFVRVDWPATLAAAFAPTGLLDRATWTQGYVMNVVAILGTTISPYLFFWQTDQEVEERRAHHAGSPKPAQLRDLRADTWVGMLFSNLVMFFIIVTAATALRANGVTEIGTAADAAKALEPFAGRFAAVVFALGVIGTGLLAVPVLAGSAAYAVAEAVDMKRGLHKNWHQARGFYGVMVAAMLVGMALNFAGVPPFRLLYYTAIINGLVAPPLLVVILQLARDRQVMGDKTIGPITTVMGWFITAVMSVAGLALIWNAVGNVLA